MPNPTATPAEPSVATAYCYAPTISRHLYSAIADNYAVNVQAHGPAAHHCTTQIVAVFENNFALHIRSCHLRAVAQMLIEAADAIERHSQQPSATECIYCAGRGMWRRPYQLQVTPCPYCPAGDNAAKTAASTSGGAGAPSADSQTATAVLNRS